MNLINSVIPFGSPELKQPKELPVSIVFKLDKKIIQLVGTDHTKDLLNTQIVVIESLFANLKNGIDVKKSAVVIDGRFPTISDDISKDECIRNYGEQGYVGYLAKKAGTEFKTVEPSFEAVIQIALNDLNLNPYNLASWSFLNFMTFFIKPDNTLPNNSRERIEPVINSFSKNYGLAGDTQSIYKRIVEIIKTEARIIFPATIDGLDKIFTYKEELRKAQEPNINGTTIQKIGAELNRARDYGIFQNIIKLQSEGYDNVFAVLGWNHVLSETPAFRKIGYKAD